MTATAHRPSTLPARVRQQEDIVTSPLARRVLAVARIVIGSYFVWAFLDKLFGLGFTTAPERSVLAGGTPAQGYINNAIADDQPLKSLYQTLFANPFGDAIFMLGLLGIGVAMLVGAGVRIAAVSGVLLMLFMYLVALPWVGEHGTNPVLDSHWMEAMLLLIPAVTLAGDTWGAGRWWARTSIVQRFPVLR
ncbi:DoxX family protein [Litorihabitans aurantiacus]|uniref:Membrane protein n=1 Tax=Litorihabitans aurantiacus TaxID=1930061 RepID=A0AA38CWF3_9MICO|nr:DoxX family protein [Litorihabitans aurantiacus]GMA33415.1 membrane protein [Litorihabitans aurantiacus]